MARLPPSDPRWRPRRPPPAGLLRRYGLRAGRDDAWRHLYEREPELYDRLVEGEPLHPQLFRAMPLDGAVLVEVGAGTGRFTLPAASRAGHLYAVEPVAAMRAVLARKLAERGIGNVSLLEGRAEAIPLPDGVADLTISASAVGADHGGEDALGELRRVTRARGQVVVLWPDDPGWFIDRGFGYVAYPGELEVRFRDLPTALACADIFYTPEVTEHFQRSRRPVIGFAALGVNPPRDLCRLTLS
ncbi:MAG TPA: methyltransferase domain-containing protein [Candidatus Limnocylindrales bacterium]|nr:methyltransferase domain-containing protein [Candidatus Limnocylindrales bacterium]